MSLHGPALAMETFDSTVDASLLFDCVGDDVDGIPNWVEAFCSASAGFFSKWMHIFVLGAQYCEQHSSDFEHFIYITAWKEQWICVCVSQRRAVWIKCLFV